MVCSIRKGKSSQAGATRPPGEIWPDVLYGRNDALARLGWGEKSLRDARANGLPVKYVGRCSYIYGADIIQFVLKNGSDSRQGIAAPTEPGCLAC